VCVCVCAFLDVLAGNERLDEANAQSAVTPQYSTYIQ
jgi:hypothetical protein